MSEAITGQVVGSTTEATALVQVDRVVGEVKVLIQQVAMSHYEIGNRLIWLKENTPQGRFLSILEEELNGTISIRNAQKLMMCARKLGHLPKVKALSDEQFTKAAILLTNLSDDTLQNIEGGDSDLTLDRVEVMSTRELRTEIKRLKDNEKKIREDEKKHHENTIRELEDKIGELEAQHSEAIQDHYLVERVEKIVKSAGIIKTIVNELVRYVGHDNLSPVQRATTEGSLALAQRLTMGSYRTFLNTFPLED